MKGLYPIIRRVRRPLLPAEDLQAPQPVLEPTAPQPDVPTPADASPPPTEQTEEKASGLPPLEPAPEAPEPPAGVVTPAEPVVAQSVVQEAKPKRTSNGRKAKTESA